ncbi:MAG: hypothetical protein PHE38_12280 [Alishewanella agri]|nr:hypothetical protein [Alishewanella agri]
MAGDIPAAFEANMASLNAIEPLKLLKLQIETPDTSLVTFRFCLQKTISWKGQSWAVTPFMLSGEGNKAGGEQMRPSLVLPNPDGIFSYYISEGWLDRARVWKYEVHPDDLESGASLMSTWYVSKVDELNNKAVSLQLAALSDGNAFKLPARRFIQPEFPLVRLY